MVVLLLVLFDLVPSIPTSIPDTHMDYDSYDDDHDDDDDDDDLKIRCNNWVPMFAKIHPDQNRNV